VKGVSSYDVIVGEMALDAVGSGHGTRQGKEVELDFDRGP